MRKPGLKIAIIGKAGRSKGITEILEKRAREIGKEIAREGAILITGACMGVAEIAAVSALKEDGIVLSFSPAKNLKEHLLPPVSYPFPASKEIPLFTGIGKVGRNLLSIMVSDGVIVVGGGAGTLNEFSVAYHEGKIIGVLEGVGGIVEKILKFEKELTKGTGKIFGTKVIKDRSPKRLVKKVIEAILKRESLPKKEVPITFENKRKKQLVGILHLPDFQKNKISKPPLLVICHGFQKSKTQKKYLLLARSAQKLGILVLRFDFEGCGDSEGDPKDLTVKREVSDLESAIQNTLAICDIDSRNIAILGDSLGACVATLFAKTYKNKIKTLIFWSPALCQKKLLKKWYSEKEIQKLKKKRFIFKKEKEISFAYYLENKNKDYSKLLSEINLPILAIHGSKDEDIPLEFSKKLAKNYKNFHLKVIKGANHKFENLFSQKKAISFTLKWLKKYLLTKRK